MKTFEISDYIEHSSPRGFFGIFFIKDEELATSPFALNGSKLFSDIVTLNGRRAKFVWIEIRRWCDLGG